MLYVVRASNVCLLRRSPVKPGHCPVLEGRCRTVHGTFVLLLPGPTPTPTPTGPTGRNEGREENGALGHGASDWLVRMAKWPGHASGGGLQDRAGAGSVEGKGPSALTALFQLSELGVWRRGGGGARQQRAGTKQKPSIASGWLGVCCTKYTEPANWVRLCSFRGAALL